MVDGSMAKIDGWWLVHSSLTVNDTIIVLASGFIIDGWYGLKVVPEELFENNSDSWGFRVTNDAWDWLRVIDNEW